MLCSILRFWDLFESVFRASPPDEDHGGFLVVPLDWLWHHDISTCKFEEVITLVCVFNNKVFIVKQYFTRTEYVLGYVVYGKVEYGYFW